jgi:hypothetical protein
MKISELIAILEQRQKEHRDVEVEVTWEDGTHCINSDNVWLAKGGVLYIDADENFYKESTAVDPHEGECTQSIKA